MQGYHFNCFSTMTPTQGARHTCSMCVQYYDDAKSSPLHHVLDGDKCYQIRILPRLSLRFYCCHHAMMSHAPCIQNEAVLIAYITASPLCPSLVLLILLPTPYPIPLHQRGYKGYKTRGYSAPSLVLSFPLTFLATSLSLSEGK